VDEKRDSVSVEITDNFSKLQALSVTVEIERRNIDITQRRADYAAYRFRNGELSNRDVVEAQNDLLSAVTRMRTRWFNTSRNGSSCCATWGC